MKHRSMVFVASAIMSLACLAPSAQASHFRFGSIIHKATAVPGTVDITLRVAYRGSYFNPAGFPIGSGGPIGGPALGTPIQVDANLDFGDGQILTQGSYTLPVVARSTGEDWIIVERTFTKHYAGPGPYNITFGSCCRIGTLFNGANLDYQLQAMTRPYSMNSSPVTSSAPIVFMTPGVGSTFVVPASDPNNDHIRFSLAGPGVAHNGAPTPNISINPVTGLITWNNAALPQAPYYTIQILIEDLDANNLPKSRSVIDLLLKIAPPVGTPPTLVLSPAGPFKVNPGQTLTFNVTGADVDPGAVVSVANTGIPSGATMTPAQPMTGASPQVSGFAWTPTAGQEGDYSITYIATDNNSNQALASVSINVNHPPTAHAGAAQTLECSGGAAWVTLDGSGSDADNDALTYTWYDESNTIVATGAAPTISAALGSHTYTLVVSDGAASASSTVSVTVEDTQAPVPDVAALADVTGECAATVAAPTATDACGGLITGTTTDPLTYTQQGTYTVTWTYDDGNGNSTQQTQTVVVADVTPPVIVLNTASTLWPANHLTSTFTLAQMVASATDNCELTSLYISKVTSDEPDDIAGNGDGATTNDISLIDCSTVDLRAERAGSLNGRVYTVFITAVDIAGNMTTVPYTVSVPKSNNDIAAVKDADAWDVTSACPAAPKSTATARAASTLDLGQNYPNPFNPSTTIEFSVPSEGPITLRVFDMSGTEVATIVRGTVHAGAHRVSFDASTLPSGVYMYRLEQNGMQSAKLMQLMK